MTRTFEQLFKKLPYSEIDIKLEISQGPFSTEVGWTIDGCDEWGYKTHLSSGIAKKVKQALSEAKEDLESELREITNAQTQG